MMGGAAEIEQRAATWLARREEPDWSVADQAALDAWLAQATAHRVAYLRLESVWRRADRLAALASPGAPAKRGRAWFPVRMAAGLAMAAALGAGLMVLGPDLGRRSYATELGGHATIPLKDGTRLELNTDTRVRTDIAKDHRAVWLDRGEAYFEVAHDASRPFVIYAGSRKLTVLGTKFSVRRTGDGIELAVVEGRVRVDPARPAPRLRPAVATRGAIVIAKGDSTLLAPPSPQRVANELSWRQGMLVFDQSSLSDAVAEFNRYNAKKLVVTDAAAGSIRIGGSFEAQNIDAFARLLEQGFGLKVETQGDEITISS